MNFSKGNTNGNRIKYQISFTKNIYDYITSDSGTMRTLFYIDPFDASVTSDTMLLSVLLFDPIYHDGRALIIIINLGKIDNGTWQNNNDRVSIQEIYKEREASELSNSIDYQKII